MALITRTACDMLMEISLHLIEQVCDATINGGTVSPGSNRTIGLTSVVGCYVGAQVVVGWGEFNAEIITIAEVNQAASTITAATIVNLHVSGETVLGPTFPTQAPTDPLWTQAEMLEYLARAQNEFLLKCPVLLAQFTDQLVTLGNQFQDTPATVIELERVAVQDGSLGLGIVSISRAGGVVTATTAVPSGFTSYLDVWIDGVLDSSFNSNSTARADLATITSVSEDGLTLTWNQTGPDAGSSGGTVNQLLYPRLYESAQEQIALQDPQWFYNQASAVPTNWYEDRTGNYQWGVAPIPRGSYLMDLLGSVRGPASLGLLDSLVVPEILCHFVKYKTMEYALTKDGENRSPSFASYCRQRFDLGVAVTNRYLDGVVDVPSGAS